MNKMNGILKAYRDFLASFGQRNDAILTRWLGENAGPETILTLATLKKGAIANWRRKGLAPLPGSKELVERLEREGWPRAIVSSGPRANLETVLDVLRFRTLFQATVSVTENRPQTYFRPPLLGAEA